MGQPLVLFVCQGSDSCAVVDVGFTGLFWDPLNGVLGCADMCENDAVVA